MTLRFYDGGSFKILAAKPLVHWFFVFACLVFRALLLLPFAVDMDSYLVLAATNLTSTSMTMTTWAPTTGPTRCKRDESDPCALPCTEHADEDAVTNICSETWRTRHNLSDSGVALTFCDWRTYHSLGVLDGGGCLNQSQEDCGKCLRNAVAKDCQLRDIYEEYVSILKRYDCNTEYSMWNCEDCKDMYKDWLCATQLPYYDDTGRRVKPCLDHCRWARRKCPYLLPHKQYCGQQSFLCPEERDLLWENATYATSEMACLDCNHVSEMNNKVKPCASELLRAGRSRSSTIHSIPFFAVIAIVVFSCLVSLVTTRTLCDNCLT